MAIISVGAPPVPDRRAWLRSRIVLLIDAGVRNPFWQPGAGRFRQGIDWGPEYRNLPGSLPWWEVRQRVGGAVKSAEFIAAVDDLVADGEVIEVWLNIGDGRSSSHSLLRPGRSDSLKHPVACARGLPDILEAEPRFAGLSPIDPVHTNGA